VHGEPATVERMGREHVVEHWKTYLKPDRLLVSVAGAVDPMAVVDLFDRLFRRAGRNDPVEDSSLPLSFPLRFLPGKSHRPKDLEQEQIAVCFPGASAVDEDEAVERVVISILSGGMSSRLWQSIREKQGLVYWVGAWFDRPRTGGMIHLGSSCTPPNLEATSEMLLKEVNRLADDVTEAEVQRAISGILAAALTHGDTTRAKATRMVNDLFYFGRPIPLEEKLARVRAVTTDDVQEYLRRHPREQLSIVTVGPRCLKDFGSCCAGPGFSRQ
ncbi:MAG: M16 family metallopeptidase, partial [Phycisphaerae bacterium]